MGLSQGKRTILEAPIKRWAPPRELRITFQGSSAGKGGTRKVQQGGKLTGNDSREKRETRAEGRRFLLL